MTPHAGETWVRKEPDTDLEIIPSPQYIVSVDSKRGVIITNSNPAYPAHGMFDYWAVNEFLKFMEKLNG